jgi:hypothetical protein
MDERGMYQMDLCVVVHGGLTFAAPRSALIGESNSQWTFGFDCGHAGDFMPALHAGFSEMGLEHVLEHSVYRDRDYVVGEASRLAAQLRIVQERGYR